MFANRGMIERELYSLSKKCDVEMNGKKLGEIYEELLGFYPDLKGKDALNNLASKFIDDFREEYSYQGYRVFYHYYTAGNDDLMRDKYHNQMQIYNDYVNSWLSDNDVVLDLDILLLGFEVKRKSKDYFFEVNDNTLQLWGVVKTIKDSCFNEDLINVLMPEIKILLLKCRNKYYYDNILLLKCKNNCDNLFDDEGLFRELYLELSEVLHLGEGIKGYDFGYDFDGYGNTVFSPTGEVKKEYSLLK